MKNKENITFVDQQRLLEIQDQSQLQEIALVGQALSSPTRLEILRLLNQKPYLMSEISTALNIQPSSASFHLKMLENAGLINIEYSTKHKGTLKWYSYGIRDVLLRLRPLEGIKDNLTPYSASIPIGSYTNASFSNIFGMASEFRLICLNDDKDTFHPERNNAQIIWNRFGGFLEYTLANSFASSATVSEISLSMELCSETNGYNHDFPSDITFWINGVELCTFTCPGDYGDKYGTFTPTWWYPESTKYGLLTTVTVKTNGVYLNGKIANKNVCLRDLNLAEGNKLLFKVGVKEDAEHLGGFNIFGEKFGNFKQNINFTAYYKK